jgi:hypothetical protein
MPRPLIGETPMTGRRRTSGTLSCSARGWRPDPSHTPPDRQAHPDPARERYHRRPRAVLQAEYADWLDALPDNLEDSALADALQAIILISP